MNNSAIKILVFLLFVSMPVLAQLSPRKVAWVHGFGGSYCSLETLSEYFDDHYDIQSIRIAYNTQKGIASSGTVVAKLLNRQFDSGDNRNLGIGHSMGGLNLRFSEVSDPSIPLRGVISIGSPHQGAALASAYINGELDVFINKMADDLLAGPKADKFVSGFTYKLDPVLDIPLIQLLEKSEFTVTDLVQLFGKGKSFDFLSYLLDSESTIQDLSPGSRSLSELNEIRSERRGYALWGDEDSPVHWRFLSSLIGSSCEENIGDVTDELLLNKVKLIKNLYQGMETSNRVLCQMAYFFTFGLGDKKSMDLCLLANKYGRGKNWIIDSEEHWLKLIGATFKTTALVTTSQFICQKELEEARRRNDFKLVRELLDNDECWLVYKSQRAVWLKQASDGLVTRQSASAIPNAEMVIRAAGANHFELLNHESVKEGLEYIFSNQSSWPFIAKR